jgi:N-acetylglutamate synthase-like GNAT family acetyltransferase
MAYSIRKANTKDFESICDLVVALELISERSRITNTFDGSSYWVAVNDNGSIIGCVGLEHGEQASLLRSAAVLPESQGIGVGRALSVAAIEGACDQGDLALYLISTGAGPYWQRFGFVEVPVDDLVRALPTVPQVRSGIERGWLAEEVAWTLTL